MYLVFTASKDTYITNKIVTAASRATDANLGAASTIDIFKLYDENTISGETTPNELSRGLLKFNLSDISASLTNKVSFDNSSFKATLKLHDVQGNQVAPSNFTIALFPLSKSFDEGKGKDVAGLGFLDRSNWITASYTTDNNTWNATGAFASGTLNANNIDIIEDGSIGGSSVYLVKTQSFVNGSENLILDVTNIVSASMVGILPDHGFLIGFSGSQEIDKKSRFVKRFSSRHTKNPYIRPKLIIEYDDTMTSSNNLTEFNVTGSLFLKSFSKSQASNILSGSANTEIGGHNCILLKLHTGSFAKYFTGSQHTQSGLFKTGIYTASVNIDRYSSSTVFGSTTLSQHVNTTGSITFGQEWLSLDESVSYFTGSITVSKSSTNVGVPTQKLKFKIVNLRSEYNSTDVPKLDVFISDLASELASVRIPIQLPSIVIDKVYYRIKDAYNGKILTPFTEARNVTRLSSDENGMFFNPSLSHLPKGKVYSFDFMTNINDVKTIYPNNGAFRIL